MSIPITPVADDLVYLDETEILADTDAPNKRPVWRILIIDDDSDVHAATTFALGKIEMQGRPLEFLHAYSATEARRLLVTERNIAVILLDVVMEQEDAGLRLVRFIRQDCHLVEVRIILRTGQPGYAPEMDAIRDYDINDYKTKSELTRIKLFTAVTAAIRSYEQICVLSDARRGLNRIVQASAELMALQGLRNFSDGVINRVGELLDQSGAGVLVSQERPSRDPLEFMIAAGNQHFHKAIGQSAQSLANPALSRTLLAAVDSRENVHGNDNCALFFGTTGCDFVLYQTLKAPLTDLQKQLIKVFSSNMAIGFENMRLMARLHAVAFFDPLCKLPNRARLVELINQSLLANGNEDVTLALIDIDHFAETNDAFGHQFGDALLLAVAARLQAALGEALVIARVGGDTFCVLGESAQVNPVTILALFTAPFSVDDEAVPMSATMGLVRLSGYEGGGADALKDADIALKRAKMQQRSGHFYFSRNMGVDIRERVRLMHALRSDFAQRKLTLVYQPQIDLASRKAVGAEALLRWRTEDGAFIAPDVFIPIAEHSGLIIDLGEWVLRTACEELVRLRALGFTEFMMSVNVSQVQFRHPLFLDVLLQALTDTGAPPAFVELEITESVAMEDPAFLIKTLEEIKRTGVSIAIDDFGTGFSSLSYLQQLKVDRLKIDRAFVNEITASTRGSSIAEMVIQLGHNLGLAVIAEGVEDERQADILCQLGCPLAQGYLFARPMAPELLPDWLQLHNGR
ncbi:diguanylate cyclase (GGDEF)-like protein [Actimicrobium sp. GrIS 1.19]|uniref:putative bifunctional diguanylate cyclase/phosphodiesterase n=1 Tax=Actimicrobium sp. GrIS 1.19 TaxID=3071708 RepID=UPI002DF90135|nr:diguanylate cyclase (GGDEF)-like protein [Actimicrobium sp. GrIS 1.19]